MSRLNIASNPPTRRIGETVHSFATARRFLNGKDQRKLANNTTVIRLSDDAIGVKLHSTIIVEYYDDGRVILRSGGYHTRTTAQRINQLLPPGAGVFQKDYTWYVSIRGETREFHEGITLMDDSHAPVSYPEPFPILVGDEAKAYQPTAVARLLRQHKSHGTNPPRTNEVSGYLASAKIGEVLTDFNGKPVPVFGPSHGPKWIVNEVVKSTRDSAGSRVAVVILAAYRRKNEYPVAYAGGLLLIDDGSLFRGERLSPEQGIRPAEHDRNRRQAAIAEADYWLERDAEDRAEDYAEESMERRLGGGDEGYDYDEEG